MSYYFLIYSTLRSMHVHRHSQKEKFFIHSFYLQRKVKGFGEAEHLVNFYICYQSNYLNLNANTSAQAEQLQISRKPD